MTDWFAQESFWEELFDFLFPETRFAAAEAEVDALLRLVNFQGQAVLDLPCGPGRHALVLARRGYHVTGVDRSPYLLGQARARAAEAGAGVEWVEADMRDFVRPQAFDLALNLFSSFGYFDDAAEDRRVLHNFAGCLRPGGALVLDLNGKETMARRYQPVIVTDLPGGGLFIDRPRIVEDWTRVETEWTVIRGDAIRRYAFRLRLYAASELKQRLAEAGFRQVKVYGDLEGSPYGPDAKRLVAVALK